MGIPVPHTLLDHLMVKYNLKNDAALARFLAIRPPEISRIRNCRRPVLPAFILQVHDVTDLPIKDIKALCE